MLPIWLKWVRGTRRLELPAFDTGHIALEDPCDLLPEVAGVVGEVPVVADGGLKYPVVLGPALLEGGQHVGSHLPVGCDLVHVHVRGVKGGDQVPQLRLQELGPLEVGLLPDGVDHLHVVFGPRAQDDRRFGRLPQGFVRVAGAQVDEGMERVLPFDGANFLRLLKPRLQAICINPGRVASNPSQFSLDHIGGQPPKAQAQVRVDRAGDDETRPEGVRVRDVERTGTRNQLKLELAPEPGRLDLDPLDGVPGLPFQYRASIGVLPIVLAAVGLLSPLWTCREHRAERVHTKQGRCQRNINIRCTKNFFFFFQTNINIR